MSSRRQGSRHSGRPFLAGCPPALHPWPASHPRKSVCGGSARLVGTTELRTAPRRFWGSRGTCCPAGDTPSPRAVTGGACQSDWPLVASLGGQIALEIACVSTVGGRVAAGCTPPAVFTPGPEVTSQGADITLGELRKRRTSACFFNVRRR